MKRLPMKRALALLGTILITLLMTAQSAFSWGSATHAYIDDHIGKKSGQKNFNELHGGMAPDTFNFMFDHPAWSAFLYAKTHDDFDALRGKAKTGQDKALAFGFVSHNDLWGADHTAHHSGLTYGQGQGYVIAKALILQPAIQAQVSVLFPGLPSDMLFAISMEFAHDAVEYAVDILIKDLDPAIGLKIMAAAESRAPDFPELLVRTYAEDLQNFAGLHLLTASRLIVTTERDFRRRILLYGEALTQDKQTALDCFSAELAQATVGFLSAYGLSLSPGVDVTPLIEFFMAQAMELCGGDFGAELNATIQYLDLAMGPYSE
jgi:hypothetical protein